MVEFDLNEEQGKTARSYKDSAESCFYCFVGIMAIAAGCWLYNVLDAVIMNFNF